MVGKCILTIEYVILPTVNFFTTVLKNMITIYKIFGFNCLAFAQKRASISKTNPNLWCLFFLQKRAWNSVRNQSKYFFCCWSSPGKSSASVTRLKDFFLVELNSNAFANEKLTSKHVFVLTVEMSTRQWAKVNTSICLICFHITHTDWTKSSSRSHVHLCDVVPCDHTSWQTPIAGQLTSFRIFEPLEKNFKIGF